MPAMLILFTSRSKEARRSMHKIISPKTTLSFSSSHHSPFLVFISSEEALSFHKEIVSFFVLLLGVLGLYAIDLLAGSSIINSECQVYSVSIFYPKTLQKKRWIILVNITISFPDAVIKDNLIWKSHPPGKNYLYLQALIL